MIDEKERPAGNAGSSGSAPTAEGGNGGMRSGIGDQLASAAREVAHDAKDKIASMASSAKDEAMSAAEGHKGEAADAIDGIADALHKTAGNLEGQQDWIAKLVEQGAGELTGLSTALRSNDLQGLLGKLQDLAQRQPAVFAGAAIAAGFAAARLGKAVVAGASEADLPKMPESRNEPN